MPSVEHVLYYDVEVLACRPGVKPVTVTSTPAASTAEGAAGDGARRRGAVTTKRTTVEGAGWETPRPPFDVTVEAWPGRYCPPRHRHAF